MGYAKILREWRPSSIWNDYLEFHARSGFKIRYVALIGAAGFPAYYAIWKYIIPQPFESVLLRAIGMLLCTGIFLRPYWPLALQRYAPHLSYFGLCYALPLFFTIMLFANNFNIVWQLSYMSGILFIILLYDLKNAIIVTLLGTFIGAAIANFVFGATLLHPEQIYFVPVFVFTFLGISFLTFTERRIGEEKLQAAFALATQVAHEVRTPLLGLTMEGRVLQRRLPEIGRIYDWAAEHGCADPALTSNRRATLRALPDRILAHTAAANQVIDMITVNMRHQASPDPPEELLSMKAAVESAVAEYALRTHEEHNVQIDVESDFLFRGEPTLFKHVIFNLLKNALRAIQAKGEGNIRVTVRATARYNQLSFEDTGVGIAPAQLRLIFIPFVSFSGERTGTGVGLAFCKSVIENMGGTISVASKLGKFTLFQIRLPVIDT